MTTKRRVGNDDPIAVMWILCNLLNTSYIHFVPTCFPHPSRSKAGAVHKEHGNLRRTRRRNAREQWSNVIVEARG